jgi:hypothetical protein
MTSTLGKISEGVVEQLKSTGSQTAAQIMTEPAKILEQILGGSAAVEQGQQTNPTDTLSATDSDLLHRKKQESQETTTALYRLHKQRLQEEKQHFHESKQKQAQLKQVEDRQDKQKEQIVQLKKEREDETAWQEQIKAVQGSHEGQQGKM